MNCLHLDYQKELWKPSSLNSCTLFHAFVIQFQMCCKDKDFCSFRENFENKSLCVHITCKNMIKTAIIKCIGWKGKTPNRSKSSFSEKINITTSSSNSESQFIVCFNYERWFITLKWQWLIKRSICNEKMVDLAIIGR